LNEAFAGVDRRPSISRKRTATSSVSIRIDRKIVETNQRRLAADARHSSLLFSHARAGASPVSGLQRGPGIAILPRLP
jgi:hypothetical protein